MLKGNMEQAKTKFDLLTKRLDTIDTKVTVLLRELGVDQPDVETAEEEQPRTRKAPKMRLAWQGQLNAQLIRYYNEGRRTDWIAQQIGCDRNRVQSAITRLRNVGLLPRRNGGQAEMKT